MKVVGVGPAPGHLTEKAIEEIKNARIVYGSKRALEIAKRYIQGKKIVLTNFRGIKSREEGIILSTGDPMVSGLGYMGDEIIPGISSVQLVCARLKVDLCECVVIDAHGKELNSVGEDLKKTIEMRRYAIILGDDKFSLKNLKTIIGDRYCWICENLGYRDERVTYCKISDSPEIKSSLVVVVVK